MFTKDPGGFISKACGQRHVEELLSQPGVPSLLLLDNDEDDHPEHVEQDEEPGTQSNGDVVPLCEDLGGAVLLHQDRLPWRASDPEGDAGGEDAPAAPRPLLAQEVDQSQATLQGLVEDLLAHPLQTERVMLVTGASLYVRLTWR